MTDHNANINSNYPRFYGQRTHSKVYPTEFVVRTLIATYPDLQFKRPVAGDAILDIAFGDGRNTVLLCDMGYEPVLRVGRNNSIPFDDDSFDYILACHCCYYCDEGHTLIDNLAEYRRVSKPGGVLIGSVANASSCIFQSAKALSDGTWLIENDPYNNRNGYRLQAFSSAQEIVNYFSPYFEEFSFGSANNNYFGIDERLFWVVCHRK